MQEKKPPLDIGTALRLPRQASDSQIPEITSRIQMAEQRM